MANTGTVKIELKPGDKNSVLILPKNTKIPAEASVLNLKSISTAFSTIRQIGKAGKKVMDLWSPMVKAASDLQEVSDRYENVFKGMIQYVDKWVEDLVENYAMSIREAKDHLSSLQKVLVSKGMEKYHAAELSYKIVQNSADQGSYHNLPTAHFVENTKSALVGSYKAVNLYGANIDAETIQQQALRMGLSETEEELTAADKARAIYALIHKTSGDAVGDMKKESGSYANLTKQFEAERENIYASIGEKALGPSEKTGEFVLDALNNVTDFFEKPSQEETLQKRKSQIEALKALRERTFEGAPSDSMPELLKKVEDKMHQVLSNENVKNDPGINSGASYDESAKSPAAIDPSIIETEKNRHEKVKEIVAKENTLHDESARFRLNTTREALNHISAFETAHRIERAYNDMTVGKQIYDRQRQAITDIYNHEKKTQQESLVAFREAHEQKYADMKRMNTLTGEEEFIATEAFKEYQREKTLASNNFFAGFVQGLDDSSEKFDTWAEHGSQLSQEMAGTMQSTLSDSLFAVIKGDIDSVSALWDSAMDTMLKKLTDTVAQMVVEWAITKAIGFGKSVFDGFFSFESGAWNIDPSVVGKMYPDAAGQPGIPAVVHEGEMIIPAGVADNLRDQLAGIGVTDFKGLNTAITLSNDQFTNTLGKAFFTEMGKHGAGVLTSAFSLTRQGYDISMGDVLDGLLSGQAIYQAGLNALTTAVNTELGLRSDKSGIWGQWLGAAIGGTVAGAPGATLMGALGAAIGMGIGDATNSRSNEAWRDFWENQGMSIFDTGRAVDQVLGVHGHGGSFFDHLFGRVPETDINDPINYDLDYGPAGYDDNDNDFSPGSPFSEPGVNDSGVAFGFKHGGVIDRLMVPRGEDGWAPVQFNEGVVSRKGMKTLDRINDGTFQTGDLTALVTEIRGLRADLRRENHPMVKAAKETARNTGVLTRR